MRDWVSAPACALLASVLLLAIATPTVAGELRFQSGIFSDPEFEPTINLGTSLSQANGSAHEFVYHNAGTYEASELDWQINNVTMLNADLNVRLTPWLAFQLEGSTLLRGSSHLDDYDWVWHGPNTWDLWSDSPDSTVKSANRADFSAELSLYRHRYFTIDALAGLRWTQWEFQATGGTYVYTSDAKHFRDQTGAFPDIVAITYTQDMLTPYLGLGLNANIGRFGLNASATGSEWVFASTYDQHHLRTDISKAGGLFNDSMHNGTYYDVKVGGTYKYSEYVDLTAGWEREDFLLTKGHDTVYAIGTGVNGTGGAVTGTFGGPSGGMDNNTDRYTIGVTYKLH